MKLFLSLQDCLRIRRVENLRYAVISRSTTWSDGQTLTASALNGEFNVIQNDYNGNITNANISASAAIAESKLTFSGSGHGHTGGTDGKLISSITGVNNTAVVQQKDTGGTARNMINVDASNNLQVGDSSLAGHIVLNPGASKLIKTTVLEQIITSNTYRNSVIILTGWSFITGDGASTTLTKAITFGVTFTTLPILLISRVGAKVSSDPTALSDYTSSPSGTDQIYTPGFSSLTTSGFTAFVNRTDFLALTAYRYGFSWIAIGGYTG